MMGIFTYFYQLVFRDLHNEVTGSADSDWSKFWQTWFILLGCVRRARLGIELRLSFLGKSSVKVVV